MTPVKYEYDLKFIYTFAKSKIPITKQFTSGAFSTLHPRIDLYDHLLLDFVCVTENMAL